MDRTTPLIPNVFRSDSSKRRMIPAALSGAAAALALLLSAAGALEARWLAPAVVAGVFFALPVEAGFWVWFASTFTQGVVPESLGWSLNILGLLAFWSGMIGAVIRRPDFFRSYRLPSGALFFLLVAGYFYFAAAAIQGVERNAALALASLKHLTVSFITTMAGVGVFAGLEKRRGDAAGRRRFAWGVVALTAAMALLGVLESILGRDLFVQGIDTAFGYFRINGVAPNPIVYGFHIAWAIPLAFYLAASEGGSRARMIATAALGLLYIACFLTLNRQTFVLMAALGFGAAALMRGGWMRWLVAGGVVAILATSPVVVPKVVERFALLGDLHYDTSFKYRRDNFRVASEIVAAHPVTGIGLGQYPRAWREFMPDNLFYMHYDDPDREFYNDLGYMQIATETGVVGVAFFLVWIAAAAAGLVVLFARAKGRISRDEPRAESDISSPAGVDSTERADRNELANWFAALLLLVAFVFMTAFIQDTFLRPRLWLFWALAAYWTSRPSSFWPQRGKDA